MSRKVVALVPAWQSADYVRETLDSLAAQTWPNLEVLISVDLSDDDTAKVCRAFAKGRANVTVHAQTERLGWVGNVNWLLGEAKGDYLFFAFHDDVVAPTYVADLAQALDADPSAVIAFTDLETRNQDGSVEVAVYDQLEHADDVVSRGRRLLWRIGPWWVPNRGLFRAEAARRIGGLKRHAQGEFSADWPWLTHMALIGRFVRVPGVQCFKRYTPRSLSRTWSYKLPQWRAALDACEREIGAGGLSWPDRLALMLSIWSIRLRWLLRLQNPER